MANLVEVLATPNRVEARLVSTVLEEAGLHATVLSEGLASVLGAGELAIPCRVMVPESEIDDARQLLAAMRQAAARASEDSPERCPSCGATWEPGFDVCWQCGPGNQEPNDSGRVSASGSDGIDGFSRTFARRSGLTWTLLPVAVLSCTILAIVLPVPSAALALPAMGLAIWAAWWLLFAPVQLRVDLHALHVDGQRVLWDELVDLQILDDRIRWQLRDNSEDGVRAVIGTDDRTEIEAAISRMMARPRDPRDPDAEEALSRLSDAPKG